MTAVDVCRQLLADVEESRRLATAAPDPSTYLKTSDGARALLHLRSKAARAAVCDYLELMCRRGLDEETRR